MRKKVILILVFILIIMLLQCITGNKSFAINQTISSDINNIDSNKYPQIKEMLQKLKEEHPNWNFKILYTDLDWNEVITNEYVGHGSSPRNLVPASSSYTDEWICSTCGNTTYDSGSWRCASQKAIKYMMDPRNSLNSSDIFQFMELTYTDYNIDTIRGMVQNSSFWNNESYINAIITSAQKYNVNAYYIMARIMQEQGSDGSTLVKGQGYNGQYVGVYNVFNIGATGNGKDNVILNGLARAEKEGWTSIELSIEGGVEIIASQYIAKGQNTMYLQKFDVDNSDNKLYWHQYMTNLFAAQSEGTKLRTTFEEYNSIEKEYTFIIPVYENMPSTASTRPNEKEEEIPDNPVYGELVKCNANPSLKLRDAPNGKDTGERIYYEEIVTRIEKATEKINGTYWDKVKKSNGVEGYVARETYENEEGYKLYLIPLENNDSNEDNNNSDNTQTDSTEIVKGDLNNDGIIDSLDLLLEKKHLLGKITFSDEQLQAADVNSDGIIDSVDLLQIKKYLLGKITTF